MDIPGDVLVEVFRCACTQDRRTVLPLVGKRWAELLGPDSPAWADVRLCLRSQDVLSGLHWLRRRGHRIRSLELRRDGPLVCSPADYPALAPSVVRTLQVTIQELRLDIDVLYSGGDHRVLGCLAGLQQLRTLHVDLLQSAGGPAPFHVGAVLDAAAQLPHLLSVSLTSASTQYLPSLEDLARFKAPQVRELTASVQCAPQQSSAIRLGGLPGLTHCALTIVPRRNSRSGLPVVLDAASLAGLACLHTLAITSDGGVRLWMAGDPFRGCAALRALSLTRLQLADVLPALRSVVDAVPRARLDLSGNPELEVDAEIEALSLSEVRRLAADGLRMPETAVLC